MRNKRERAKGPTCRPKARIAGDSESLVALAESAHPRLGSPGRGFLELDPREVGGNVEKTEAKNGTVRNAARKRKASAGLHG